MFYLFKNKFPIIYLNKLVSKKILKIKKYIKYKFHQYRVGNILNNIYIFYL